MFAECLLIAHTKTSADNDVLSIKKKENLSSLREVQLSSKFRSQVQLNEKYIDGELLPQSRKNNQNIKKSINSKDIQIVLVSPQRAALQTCLDIFGEQDEIEIYVQPLLHPRINSASFIPTNNQSLLKKFKKEPHSNEITENKSWFLNFGAQDNHSPNFQSPENYCLDIMRQKGNFQPENLFVQRNKKLRKQLFGFIQKGNKKIALLSHPLMLQQLTATGWHEDGTPINVVHFDFGEVKKQHIWIQGVVAEAQERHIPFCS